MKITAYKNIESQYKSLDDNESYCKAKNRIIALFGKADGNELSIKL